MGKIKVGDTVRVKDDTYNFVGKLVFFRGTKEEYCLLEILEDFNFKIPEEIHLNKNYHYDLYWCIEGYGDGVYDGTYVANRHFREDDIHRLIKDTKLARRFYPNAEINGEWLWVK